MRSRRRFGGCIISDPPVRGAREPSPAHVSGTRCPVQPDGHGDPAGDAGDSSQRIGKGRLLPGVDGLRLAGGRRGFHACPGAGNRPHRSRGCPAHVYGGRLHSLLHYGGDRRGPGDADHAGVGGGRGPACHLQVAVHTKADRDPDRGRHRDNDIVYHVGFRRICPAGRCVTRGAYEGAVDGPGHPGCRRGPCSPGRPLVASMGAGDRNNRRFLGRCRIGNIRR